MANTITKRPRLSRRLFLKGLSAAQSSVVVGLPPLVSMFNSHGTAYAASPMRTRQHAGGEAVRALVQRQRDPGAVLDSGPDRRGLRHDAVPESAGAAAERRPRD